MNSVSQELIRRCFPGSDAVLTIGGLSVSSIAQHYGTPLFVYDRTLFDVALHNLRSVLPRGFDTYYSVKANPNLTILRHFVDRGCGLEVASQGELVLAIAAGCAPERIVFAGPGKTETEVEAAIDTCIGAIHIESSIEAMRVAQIANRRNVRVPVGVRVNPSADTQGGAMRMGGKAAPFGVDEAELHSLIRYLLSNGCFDFRGIHMSAATQVLDYTILLAQYRRCIEIAGEVAVLTGQSLQTIDFGGGLGIPYFEGDRSLDLYSLGSELIGIVDDIRCDSRFDGTRFLLEPGRFLVGEAGIYVARIVDIKKSRGKKFLVVDGGMNHHLAASGNLGQTIKRNYPIVIVDKLGKQPDEVVDIVGPLCTPLDTLGRGVSLPSADIGDMIAILQSGAYARAASPTSFLSHPAPAEILVDQGNAYVIRNPGRAEDVLRDMCVPASLDAEWRSNTLMQR